MKNHEHKPVRSVEKAFSGPVGFAHNQNPAAWGNIVIVEICECGAERHTNVNQRHIEKGGWRWQ